MLFGCRLECFWIDLPSYFHQLLGSWQEELSISHASLDDGLHCRSQGWHSCQNGSLFVVKQRSNMALAGGHAVNSVLLLRNLLEELVHFATRYDILVSRCMVSCWLETSVAGCEFAIHEKLLEAHPEIERKHVIE